MLRPQTFDRLRHAVLLSVLAAGAATAAESQSLRPDSIPRFRYELELAQQSGDSTAIADAHFTLGLAHWQDDRYDSALVHLLRVRALRTALRDSAGLGSVLNSLGATHYQAGNYEPALEAYLGSLALRRAIGDLRGMAFNYANIGKAYQDWGDYDRASVALDSAIAIAERSGNGPTLGYALNTMAAVHVDLRRHASARDFAERSLAAYYSGTPRIGAVDSSSAWSINNLLLGRIDVAEGRLEDAERRFRRIYDTAIRGQTRRGQAEAQIGLGSTYEAGRQWGRADAAYADALTASRAIANRALSLRALEGLARVAEARGDAPAALRHLRTHAALRDSVFSLRTSQRVSAMELEAEAARQLAATAELRAAQRQAGEDLRRQRILTSLAITLLALTLVMLGSLLRTNRRLEVARAEVRALSGFIPICAHCKNVRDDAGYWQSVEAYVASRSEAQFSHGICNNCGPALYGEDWVPHPGTDAGAAPAAPSSAG
ncbi:MAG: tetratricopeptide repeat protein [Gemmatimonadaceae bacterium]|nr:tetratricopeptide repeat protein [Gemmatimonadaceae bacterium]MCW5825559.1 tetratricopeptide repeat protein [Gemmatimonadaceae bacterium]